MQSGRREKVGNCVVGRMRIQKSISVGGVARRINVRDFLDIFFTDISGKISIVYLVISEVFLA